MAEGGSKIGLVSLGLAGNGGLVVTGCRGSRVEPVQSAARAVSGSRRRSAWWQGQRCPARAELYKNATEL